MSKKIVYVTLGNDLGTLGIPLSRFESLQEIQMKVNDKTKTFKALDLDGTEQFILIPVEDFKEEI